MAMGITSTGGLKPVINVTPLIDVLLVLLIIFLMIQPQHKHGLEAQVPQPPRPTQNTPPPVRTIVLELQYQQDNAPLIRINQDPATWQDLEARLREIFKERAEKIMFLKGDDKLSFSQVALAIDTARAADPGIRIGLITRDLQNAD